MAAKEQVQWMNNTISNPGAKKDGFYWLFSQQSFYPSLKIQSYNFHLQIVPAPSYYHSATSQG
jgi:hypothetical protein